MSAYVEDLTINGDCNTDYHIVHNIYSINMFNSLIKDLTIKIRNSTMSSLTIKNFHDIRIHDFEIPESNIDLYDINFITEHNIKDLYVINCTYTGIFCANIFNEIYGYWSNKKHYLAIIRFQKKYKAWFIVKRNKSALIIQKACENWLWKPICKDGTTGINFRIGLKKLEKFIN